MNLNQWAIRWGVSHDALEDLRKQFGIVPTLDGGANDLSEAAIQNLIRLEASKQGGRLFRNNVGCTITGDGRFLRYGLANDSEKLNKICKSSDLIGLRPVVITKKHVGHTIGQFMAIEVKRGDWVYSGTEREQAQLKFITLISSMGGFARFSNGG